MANNTVHTITLSGYTATTDGNCWALRLGTWDSYGVEQIQLSLGPEWTGLVITATFTPPKGSAAVKVVVDSSGLFDVPQEATALSGQGKITFAGNTSGQQRISVDVPYVVANHAAVDGVTPNPTPSEWAQFVAQVQQARDDAAAAAQAAEGSQAAAAGSASGAANSADKAAKSAQEAQNIVDGAVRDIATAKDAAVQAVNDAGNTAVQAVQQAGQESIASAQKEAEKAASSATQAAESAKQAAQATADTSEARDDALEAIQQAQETGVQAVQAAQTIAVQAVQTAQTEGVKAVNDAGDAKVEEIEQINALVPTPTPEDAGKVVVVKPDGTGYELGDVQTDSYTKAESDARYAPIASALKVKCNGTGIGTLTPTVAWRLQSLLIGGRTTQDGTPSPDSPVPFVSAGHGGAIDVTVCGANLANQVPENGTVTLRAISGASGRGFEVAKNIPSGTYIFSHGDIYSTDGGIQSVSLYARKKSGAAQYGIYVNRPFVVDDTFTLTVYVQNDDGCTYIVPNCILCAGDTAYPYTPYQSQSLPIPTPNGLPGIPVTSGGNWTDEKGQQWICDTIDFAAGTLTQRCAKIILAGIPNFTPKATPANPERFAWANAFSTEFKTGQYKSLLSFAKWTGYASTESGVYTGAVSNKLLYFTPAQPMTEEAVNTIFANLIAAGDAVIVGQLASPIETQLSTEELAAYAALQSYNGMTNIIAPDAMIQASAVADSTAIIQQMQEQILALQSATIGG